MLCEPSHGIGGVHKQLFSLYAHVVQFCENSCSPDTYLQCMNHKGNCSMGYHNVVMDLVDDSHTLSDVKIIANLIFNCLWTCKC